MALNPNAYWPFDDADGTFTDRSGNDLHLTAYGGTPDYAGRTGGDGNDYVAWLASAGAEIAHNDLLSSLPNGGITIFMIHYCVTSVGVNSAVMSKRGSTFPEDYEMLVNILDGGEMNMVHYGGKSPGSATARRTNGVVTASWSAHWWVFDDDLTANDHSGSRGTDGSIVAGTGTALAAGDGNFRIGSGKIGDVTAHVAVFPGALTLTNLATLIAAAKADGWVID